MPWPSTAAHTRSRPSLTLDPAPPILRPLQARGAAVDLRGSGRLSSVRAIYSTGHALVWLEVDSADAAPRSSGAAAAAAAAPGSEAAAPPALPGTPAPAWLSNPFDAAAFQARVAALAGGPAVAAAQQQEGQEQGQRQQQQERQKAAGAIERKAEEWCVHHHTSLAPAGEGQQAA